MQNKHIELIDEFVRDGNGNYEWIDNHGALVRCKDCCIPHNEYTGCPMVCGRIVEPNWFCADGKRKEPKNDK